MFSGRVKVAAVRTLCSALGDEIIRWRIIRPAAGRRATESERTLGFLILPRRFVPAIHAGKNVPRPPTYLSFPPLFLRSIGLQRETERRRGGEGPWARSAAVSQPLTNSRRGLFHVYARPSGALPPPAFAISFSPSSPRFHHAHNCRWVSRVKCSCAHAHSDVRQGGYLRATLGRLAA